MLVKKIPKRVKILGCTSSSQVKGSNRKGLVVASPKNKRILYFSCRSCGARFCFTSGYQSTINKCSKSGDLQAREQGVDHMCLAHHYQRHGMHWPHVMRTDHALTWCLYLIYRATSASGVAVMLLPCFCLIASPLPSWCHTNPSN